MCLIKLMVIRWESEWENPKQEKNSYSEIDLSNNKWKVSGS